MEEMHDPRASLPLLSPTIAEAPPMMDLLRNQSQWFEQTAKVSPSIPTPINKLNLFASGQCEQLDP